ncbi:MAG: hypothetical protein ABIP39_08520 [Polyangiaceae bacterium]
MVETLDLPFRWDLTRREQLGSLAVGELAPDYVGFRDELLASCARIVGFGGDRDLVFVGRSPESIFDHLSGLLFDTSWFPRLELLHFSMRFWEESMVRATHPGAITALRDYLESIRLHPAAIAKRARPVAFVDLVSSGDTLGRLVLLLQRWSIESGHDWNAVRRNLFIVGITPRTKTSPNTHRWQEHALWLPAIGRGAVKNVSISGAMWRYLGNEQVKVTRSHTPARWADDALAQPNRHEAHLKALRLAHSLFELGRTAEQRALFAKLLAKETAMKDKWMRALVLELKT